MSGGDWRRVWKADDPKWMKDRKAQWKAVKQSPGLREFDRRELKAIEAFFLTGCGVSPGTPDAEIPMAYDPDQAPLVVPYSALLECWLMPDPSPEEWRRVRARTPPESLADARRYFRQCLFEEFPASGPLFSGLEERLYRFFAPTRCRPEDYPDYPPESFRELARGINFAAGSHLVMSLARDANPCCIGAALLSEWLDSLLPAFAYLDDVGRSAAFVKAFERKQVALAAAAGKVLERPAVYRPEQVELANSLRSALAEACLTDALEDMFSLLLAD